MFFNWQDSDSDNDGEESDDSSGSHGSTMERNLLTQQNPFGNQQNGLFGNNAFGGGGLFGGGGRKKAVRA